MADYTPVTFTAPKAYIRLGNAVAGYVRGLTFQENITRGNVQGLGNLNKQEVPALSIDCTFTVDQFFIDFNRPEIKEMVNRYGSVTEVINTLTLGEFPFSIFIFAKTIVASDPTNKLITEVDNTGKTIANLNPCYVNNQSFTLQENQISGFNISGIYLNPITTKS